MNDRNKGRNPMRDDAPDLQTLASLVEKRHGRVIFRKCKYPGWVIVEFLGTRDAEEAHNDCSDEGWEVAYQVDRFIRVKVKAKPRK
jgi:hypothetical protein